jgi:RecB family exonuclease
VRLWAREEAIDEHLARELGPGQAWALRSHDASWDAFVEAIARDAGAVVLDPLVARLALREACVQATAGGPWADVATTSGFLAAAARCIDACERAELGGAALTRALAHAPAAAASGAERERLRRLARIVEAWERLTRGLGASRAARLAMARRHLAAGGALPIPASAKVTVKPRIGWDLADVALVAALARRLEPAGGRVTVELPWRAEQPAIFDGLEPVVRAFEAQTDLAALDLELGDDAPHAPADVQVLRRALGAPVAASERARGEVVVLSAASEQAERRVVAARIRALVDEGVAPEAIAVAARQPDLHAEALTDELSRVGLGLDDRRGSPLAAAPPFTLATLMLAAADEGWPVDAALAILGSRYVAGPAVGRAVRRLALRDLGPRSRARLRATRPDLADALDRWFGPLEALPRAATLAGHAQALGAALDDLGVRVRARSYDRGPAPDDSPLDPGQDGDVRLQARIDRALARDQAAIDALDQLLADLPRAASVLGLGARTIERATFAAILADAATETRLRPIGARGGAVRLLALAELAGRRFAHLFMVGLVAGQVPLVGGDDGLFGAQERRHVDRVLGRRVMALGGPVDDRTPYEQLMLWSALGAATVSVTLSHARSAGGRATIRSPFIDDVLLALPSIPILTLAPSPVPPLAAARAPADLIARAALERYADPALRLPGERLAAAAATRLGETLARAWPRRAKRVADLAGIELERFAAGRTATPFSGLVAGAPDLRARVGGGADRPLSPGALERHANCPFAFFAERVLGVLEPEEPGQAPEPRDLGTLAHDTLQRFYEDRREAGALPVVADAQARLALDRALEAAAARAEAGGRPGHPALFRLELRRLADQLWRLVEHEAARGREALPAYFELAFGSGEGSLPALLIGAGDDALHVRGRVDRVDVAPGGHGLIVLDYKLGRRSGLETRLGPEAAGVTQLQLPIYALAVRAGLAASGRVAEDATVDAAFISLRDGAHTKSLSERLGAEALGQLLERDLPARLHEAARTMRAGQFPLAPYECRNCSYRTVCRVVAATDDEEPA